MKILILLAAFIAGIGITGCSESEAIETKQITKHEEVVKPNSIPDVCYVLCDFSASQGNKSRTDISLNALKIYEAANKKCKLRYYNINAPDFEGPFFEFLHITKQAKDPRTRWKIDSMSKPQKDTLANLLFKNCSSTAPTNTCIIKSLDKIARSMKNQIGNNKELNVDIIVLSDMLEDCTLSFGKIDIDHEAFDKAFKTLGQMHSPTFTFKDFKNLTITLTASSEKNMDLENLQNFWTEVLKRYHYPLNSAITTDLPEWTIKPK